MPDFSCYTFNILEIHGPKRCYSFTIFLSHFRVPSGKLCHFVQLKSGVDGYLNFHLLAFYEFNMYFGDVGRKMLSKCHLPLQQKEEEMAEKFLQSSTGAEGFHFLGDFNLINMQIQ